MNERELMQQALDALETVFMPHHPAVIDLRDRLAQPEQELVIDCPRCGHCCPKSNQEPVVLMDAPLLLNGQPLYTTPPHRPWVGLTDEDRQALAAEQHGWEGLCFAVEAKLREKNT